MNLSWRRWAIFAVVSTVAYFVVFQPLWLLEYVTAFFLALPLFGLWQGVFAAWLFGALGGQRGDYLRLVGLLIGTDLAIALLLGWLGAESAACLFMGAPLVVPMAILGMFLAHRVMNNRSELHVSLAVLLILAPALDAHIPYPEKQVTITDTIQIKASDQIIWQSVLDIPQILPAELPWTFSHSILGVPKPVSASFKGSHRDLEWSSDVHLRENITKHSPGRSLAWTFDFHDQAALRAVDPHISPNSKFTRLVSGRYQLDATQDEGYRLRLETELVIATPMNWYFGFWGRQILSDFHISVLSVIKHRAEQAA